MKKIFFMAIFIISVNCVAMQQQAETAEASGSSRTPTPICKKKKYAPTRIQNVENDILVDARHGFKPAKPHPKVNKLHSQVNA